MSGLVNIPGVVVNTLVSINVVAPHRARLLLGWVTICSYVNHLGMYPTTYVNSAFHPSGVGKSSTGVYGWGYERRVYLCRVTGNTV